MPRHLTYSVMTPETTPRSSRALALPVGARASLGPRARAEGRDVAVAAKGEEEEDSGKDAYQGDEAR